MDAASCIDQLACCYKVVRNIWYPKGFYYLLWYFFNNNSRVSVVNIFCLLGVPNVLLGSCTSDILHAALRTSRERDTAESRKVVLLFTLVGLVQPGEFFSWHVFNILFTMFVSPVGLPYHFPLGFSPYPVFAVIPPIVFWRIAYFLWSRLLPHFQHVLLSRPFTYL